MASAGTASWMAADKRTIVEVTVIGKDRKGVVADITNFIFRNGKNFSSVVEWRYHRAALAAHSGMAKRINSHTGAIKN